MRLVCKSYLLLAVLDFCTTQICYRVPTKRMQISSSLAQQLQEALFDTWHTIHAG
jgi:hypothetical protein